MAATKLSGVRSRADHRVTPPRFPSHVAARIEADWDDSRRAIPTIPGPRKPLGHVEDSDPDADELLKRARRPRGDLMFRLETESAYLERDRQHAAQVAQEIAMADAA